MPRKTRKQKMRARRKQVQVRPPVVRLVTPPDFSCTCYLEKGVGMRNEPSQCRNPVHAAAYTFVDIPRGMQVKRTYIRDAKEPQFASQAYVNEHTGEGNDRYTDKYVKLVWSDEFDEFIDTVTKEHP